MSRVTMREVYRTLVEAKRSEWMAYRCDNTAPRLSQREFSEILRRRELLVETKTIRQKLEIAIIQGVLVPIPDSKAYAVDLREMELRSGISIPPFRSGGESERECVSPVARRRAPAREEPEASCTSGEVETVTEDPEGGAQ